MSKNSLLISISDSTLRAQVEAVPSMGRFNLVSESDGDSWMAGLIRESPELAIVQADDFCDQDLAELVAEKLYDQTEIIFISQGRPNAAIDEAMMCGVSYHLRTPLDGAFLGDLLLELDTEFEQEKQSIEKPVTSNLDQFGLLLGSSRPMRRLFRTIRKSANSMATIFIIGESGSGKELVANTIHLMSDRKEGPLVTLNCGAISPELIESELFGHVKGAFTGAATDRSGVFEQANNGTLFLDEVTEMPLDQQVKLLRVLETGEYRKVGSEDACFCDVRVVAATNREPAAAVQQGLFREDLYYRLAQFPIRVPPLRDRQGDIAGLAHHFLAYRNSEEDSSVGITAEAMNELKSFHWPGNVRDLKHAIERAYILADDTITTDHIVLEAAMDENDTTGGLPTDLSLDEVEKQVILKTLEVNDGKKSETAETLGVSVKTLYNKLERYKDEELDEGPGEESDKEP